MSDIEHRVKGVIKSKLNVDESRIVESAHIVNDLGADSLDRAELAMAFEDTFGITIPDEEAAHLVTIGSLVEYIRKKVE